MSSRYVFLESRETEVPPLLSTSVWSLRTLKNAYVPSFSSESAQHQQDMRDTKLIGTETSGATLIEYLG